MTPPPMARRHGALDCDRQVHGRQQAALAADGGGRRHPEVPVQDVLQRRLLQLGAPALHRHLRATALRVPAAGRGQRRCLVAHVKVVTGLNSPHTPLRRRLRRQPWHRWLVIGHVLEFKILTRHREYHFSSYSSTPYQSYSCTTLGHTVASSSLKKL